MAVPKKRNHPHHTNTPEVPKKLIYHKMIPVAMVIFMLFGAGFAFMASGYNIPVLLTGAAIGAVCGFLFGYQVAKGLSKK